MAYEIKTIERNELKAKLDRGDTFKLVMAMNEWAYNAAHIAGSLHFSKVEDAREQLELNDEIVVYCSDPACVASQFAYKWLIDVGYTDVRRYSGGISDWAAAGYELESNDGPGAADGVFFFPPEAQSVRRPGGPS
jgi:rhodanese-related sulfurtransferase